MYYLYNEALRKVDKDVYFNKTRTPQRFMNKKFVSCNIIYLMYNIFCIFL